MTDPTFRSINRLFVLSFKNGNNDLKRTSLDKYLNASIDNKPFFDQPVNTKQEAFEKFVEMSRNDNDATGKLLDYQCHQKCYKLIGIDLSRKTNTSIQQQTNSTEKLEKDDGAAMFFITEKHQKTILIFSLNSLIVTE